MPPPRSVFAPILAPMGSGVGAPTQISEGRTSRACESRDGGPLAGAADEVGAKGLVLTLFGASGFEAETTAFCNVLWCSHRRACIGLVPKRTSSPTRRMVGEEVCRCHSDKRIMRTLGGGHPLAPGTSISMKNCSLSLISTPHYTTPGRAPQRLDRPHPAASVTRSTLRGNPD